MTVRKALILASGYGTRFLPATKAQPKAMLPLVDKPLIQYVVEEAVAAGLEEATIVLGPNQCGVREHFQPAPHLEELLAAKGEERLLAEVRRLPNLARVTYVEQGEPLGISHAILKARESIGQEPFVLFFSDDIIAAEVPVARQLLEAFEECRGCVLAVEEVEPEEVSHYGVINPRPLREGHPTAWEPWPGRVGYEEGRLYEGLGLVEKPKPQDAPSNLAIVGRYVLTPAIFEAAARTPPGKGGEIQLTDSLEILGQEERIYAYQFRGRRYDTGRPLGMLTASLEMALARPDLGPALRRYLRRLAKAGWAEEGLTP